MTLTTKPNENALRSVAVRLYGVWAAEAAVAGRSQDVSHARVMGCVGTLIKAILPQMEVLGYTDFIQGDSRVTLEDFAAAAATAADNPDEFLHRIVARRAEELMKAPCVVTPTVEEITGVPARSFRRWAEDHVKDFTDRRPSHGARRTGGGCEHQGATGSRELRRAP